MTERQEQMRAIAVKQRGCVDNLKPIQVPKPSSPQGYDVLVQVKAVSVNPIDIKVRSGTYDDFPSYFDHVPTPHQILGYDGAGIISAVGPDSKGPDNKPFSPGDEVFYSGSPIRHGSNAEYQLVDSRSVALKPKTLSFTQAASMPLTYVTAYEALVERMGMQKGEKAAVLIVNGAGGVGSVASQIAREVLELPVVITTASRRETVDFSKKMGATHTVNHREDIVKQVKELDLPEDVALKYVFITHSTAPYLGPAAAVCAPFGKVCSIVQTKEMDKMYGTEFMAKSLSYIWCLIGTKPWYGVDVESHGKLLKELAELVDQGRIQCHMTKELRLTVEGLREAHELVEGGGMVGKVAVGVDVDADQGALFE